MYGLPSAGRAEPDNLRMLTVVIDARTRRAYSAFGSSYNEMTHTSSAIIVAIKPSMKYANLCMSMRLGKARYSA
jgi:hypothetical protein